MYMEDDRQQYMVECDIQADGLPAYLIHFLGANSFDHPFTLKLIDLGLAVGNVAYMSYKAYFKRVRPSILRPGLTVPFGPPAHPAFPSGHAFLAHFLSLLLLEIPGVAQRFGVVKGYKSDGSGTDVQIPAGTLLRKPTYSDLLGSDVIASPLLTMANRIAVNRERIGVHYSSDSTAGRHIAAGIWYCLMDSAPVNPAAGGTPWAHIAVPTLHRILERRRPNGRHPGSPLISHDTSAGVS
ncbi:phosphatase PAP2 family protein [Phaeobacter inhibens]|uniref:phosphatase PAP2 family protein n=1 Tax=Phaeobacter inhibens TaxID=221822 RepID=UPI0021A67BA4|nr:phosphatase PAP2 family protein [Phaeobacter inhibens]